MRVELRALSRGRASAWVAGTLALVISIAIPPMELIPFSANGAGIALAALGVSLLTEDGALTLAAGLIVLGTLRFTLHELV